MKIRTLLMCAAAIAVCTLPSSATSEDIMVFSEQAGKMVSVPVIAVEQTPLSELDTCTLRSGVYCGNQEDFKMMSSQDWLDLNLRSQQV